MESLRIDQEKRPEALVLHLAGPLTLRQGQALTEGLEQAWRAQVRRIRVELSGSTYVDSVGIALLVSALHRARQEGKEFSLSGTNTQARRVLEMYGLDKIPEIGHAHDSSQGWVNPAHSLGGRGMRKLLALLLALLVPFIATAQEAPLGDGAGAASSLQEQSPAAPQNQATNYPPEPASDRQPPLPVPPEFLKKKVVVRLRHGRSYEGKLLEVTEESLVLQIRDFDSASKKWVKRTERIPRSELVTIRRLYRFYHPPGWVKWIPIAIFVGALFVRVAILIAQKEKT